MNKAIIIALIFLTASVVCAGEGLQPYVLFGDSGKIVEERNQSLSAALTERGAGKVGGILPPPPNKSVTYTD